MRLHGSLVLVFALGCESAPGDDPIDVPTTANDSAPGPETTAPGRAGEQGAVQDSDPSTSSSGEDAKSGSATAARCTGTPRLLAELTDSTVTGMTVGRDTLVYGVSDTPETKRSLHALRLATGTQSVLVASDAELAPAAPWVGIIGNDAMYLTNPWTHWVAAVPLTGGPARKAYFFTLNRNPFELSSSEDGVLYTFVGGGPAGGLTRPFAYWEPGQQQATLFEGEFDVATGARMVAFNGGFVAIENGHTLAGFKSTRNVLRVDPAEAICRRVARVRPHLAAPNRMTPITLTEVQCAGAAAMEIAAAKCSYDLAGTATCLNQATPLYTVPAASQRRVSDFVVLADRSLVIAETDNRGVRPSAHVLLHGSSGTRTLGGDGTFGRVDRIGTLTTDDACVYWSEQGEGRTRIVSVRR